MEAEKKRIVVIEGEDAAPDTVRSTVKLIDKFNLNIEWMYPPVGQKALKTHDTAFPDETRQAIDTSDSTLFGASSGISFEALFYLRWGKSTYANVRPVKWVPGYKSPLAHPEHIDFVIVRENLEDLYSGIEGNIEDLDAIPLKSFTAGQSLSEMAPGRFALKVITEKKTKQIIEFAFELARKRKAEGHPGKVTCSSKYNMLFYTDGLFKEIAQLAAPSYPDIDFETFIIDDLAHRLVKSPQDLDVVVMPNLYGDILSDTAGGLMGGLGLAASGCYGKNYAYFESAHGTAPDLVGKNSINPTAQILSGAMMLEYLGFTKQSKQLFSAVERVYAEGYFLTPDQGGSSTTSEFTNAVATYL
ncbi:MAG: isocitrate/isopropylmalate dehydrogenase family protein [Deltaproteobacteria bacterium]|nr:isocitrate/isopropylmalate dehydrogenase family protein [Deltaproteobacteria bacterium]